MKTEQQSKTLDYALDYSLAVSLAGVFLVPFLRDAFGFPYAAWYVFGMLAGLSGLTILGTDAESRKRLVRAAIVVGPLAGVLLLASLVRWHMVLEDALNLAVLVALFALGSLIRHEKAVAVFFCLLAAAAVCAALFLLLPDTFRSFVDIRSLNRRHLTPGTVLSTGFGLLAAGTVAAVLRWRRVWYGLLGAIPVALVGLGLVTNRGRGAVLWAFLGTGLAIALTLGPRILLRAPHNRSEVVRSRVLAAVLAGFILLSAVVFFTAPTTGAFRGLGDLRETLFAVMEATDAEGVDSPRIWRLIAAGDEPRQWRLEESYQAIRSAPVFGGGIGGYRALTADYAHNVVLQVGVDGGILAMGSLLWFFLLPVFWLFRAIKQRISVVHAAALGGAITAALIYQTSFNFYTAPILFISIGMTLSCVSGERGIPEAHAK